jgi:hypothetical protein
MVKELLIVLGRDYAPADYLAGIGTRGRGQGGMKMKMMRLMLILMNDDIII